MAAQNHVISADSHMTEPATLWVDRLDEKFQDRAPRVIKKEGRSGYVFRRTRSTGISRCRRFCGRPQWQGTQGVPVTGEPGRRLRGARPSGWDPVERIKDQDIDGVHAEVLYTTWA